MGIPGFRDLKLTRGHGFLAQRSEQHPHVAVLLPSKVSDTRENYHDVLNQLAAAGVRRVVVDAGYLNLSPVEKLAFAYMKPTAEEVPGIEKTYVAGITKDDIWKGAHSEAAARGLENSPGFKASVDDAVAECLR